MDKGLTKNHSKMLQGLAILMMLYHHLFSTPEALGVDYVSLLKFGEANIELHMAWFFKICVGIYAFVSGYGLCRVLANADSTRSILIKTDERFFEHLVRDYKIVLKQLFWFYIQFWLVFFIFIPVGFIFYRRKFDLSEFLLNLFGISSTYNGAWWYVAFYTKILLILPLCDCVLTLFKSSKEKLIEALFYIAILGALLAFYIADSFYFGRFVSSFQPAFLLCFLVGFLISRFQLYELAIRLFTKKIAYALGILGFILVIACRVKIAKDASSAGLDFIFVPVFVFGFVVLMELWTPVSKIFEYMGKYSTFMWLTHVFFYDHYSKKLVMASHVSIGIYLMLLILSFASAYVLDVLYKLVRRIAGNALSLRRI